jgi:hypothetical protein
MNEMPAEPSSAMRTQIFVSDRPANDSISFSHIAKILDQLKHARICNGDILNIDSKQTKASPSQEVRDIPGI